MFHKRRDKKRAMADKELDVRWHRTTDKKPRYWEYCLITLPDSREYIVTTATYTTSNNFYCRGHIIREESIDYWARCPSPPRQLNKYKILRENLR